MTATLILIFAAVYLTVIALYLGIHLRRHSEAARLKKRLRGLSGGERSRESAAAAARIPGSTGKTGARTIPFIASCRRMLDQSGLSIPHTRFSALVGAASLTMFLAAYLATGSAAAAAGAAVLAALAPFPVLGWLTRKRQSLFNEQLPDTLTMLARSLRAGHSLAAAVELVGQEMPEPAGGLFRRVCEQQKLGMRVAESLQTLEERIASIDLNFIVTIIRINSETGGNLAEILEKLSETITSRLQIRRQVRVYTAEGRISAYVLVVLPLAVFALFYTRNPAYMSVFFTERICQLLLGGAVLAQTAGFFIMRRISDIRI